MAQPNPIQQVPSGLEGLFGALEALGTAFAMKGKEEEQRMVAIQNDPAQASQMATLIRQAAASGRTNEEIAAGLGFHGEKGVPFINTIAATYPQGSAERLEEAVVGQDLSGLTVDERIAALTVSRDTARERLEQGQPTATVGAEVATAELTADQAASQQAILGRVVGMGGNELQARNFLQGLDRENVESEAIINAWEGHTELAERYANSDDPAVRALGQKMGLGLTNQAFLGYLQFREGLGFQREMQNLRASVETNGLNMKDLQAIMFAVEEREEELMTRLTEAEDANDDRLIEVIEDQLETLDAYKLQQTNLGIPWMSSAGAEGTRTIYNPQEQAIVNAAASGVLIGADGTQSPITPAELAAVVSALPANPVRKERLLREITRAGRALEVGSGSQIMALIRQGAEVTPGPAGDLTRGLFATGAAIGEALDILATGFNDVGTAAVQREQRVRQLKNPEATSTPTPQVERSSTTGFTPPPPSANAPASTGGKALVQRVDPALRPPPSPMPGGNPPNLHTLAPAELDQLYIENAISWATYRAAAAQQGRN
jgi:hypothetical protein